MAKIVEPLSREELYKAIERGRPSRIPLVRAKWWGEGLHEQYGARLQELEQFPEDVVWLFMDNPASADGMDLPWKLTSTGAYDSSSVIDDWDKLEEYVARLPDPEKDPIFEELTAIAEAGRAEGRYLLFGWWNLFFEMPWQLRGMENLLCDYYTDPDKIRALYQALSETYRAYIRAAKRYLQPDGFWCSDDLGHQTGPMMSPEIFTAQIFPFYEQVGSLLRETEMHFWLHSCGDNSLLLPDLIRAGLTVFHPVQKHTMDEVKIAAEFGDKITFLAGIDVQQTLQIKSPDEVREEVRFLIDTFDRPEGGMCLAAGNGIVAGTPFENIAAFLDEAVVYGQRHRATFGPSV